MKIRAAVLDGVGKEFRVAELDLDTPKSGEIMVKVAASGLCASDLNAIDGKRKLVPFPAVIGHEASGVVTEVGPDVKGIQVGDRLQLIPGYADLTVALHNQFYAFRGGKLVNVIPVEGRGLLT
mgnify:CR=1 FL=1